MQDFWNTQTYDDAHAFVAQRGEAVVDLLAPLAGETILDMGCGTGHLTDLIRSRGAAVVGLDASEKMLSAARHNYPDIEWHAGDARDFDLNRRFDAVFTNAVLHWIPQPERVASNVFRHLKEGGRFVGEFGGHGNVKALHGALDAAARARGLAGFEPNKYFPTIGHWANVMENAGFEAQTALLFDRPTPLDGPDGAYHWLQQFGAYYLDDLSDTDREAVARDAQERARSALFRDGQWFADYRRLRFVAVKPALQQG